MYGQGYHILSLFNHCKTLKSLKQVQCCGIKFGLDNDPLFSGKLLLHCAVTISDAIEYAWEIFQRIPRPDVFMYNTLIRGLAESATPMSSVALFNEMRRKSEVRPDSFSFAFILKAVAYLRSLQCGAQLHCLALVHGLDMHLFVGTTLVSMYAECGSIQLARRAFEEICDPNVVAWNAIVTACFRCGDLAGAKVLFDRMPFRNSTSYNLMLAGYTKTGELELAREIFTKMPVKDDVSWSTMIVGFAHNACFDEAFRYFKDFQLLGIRPNEASLTGILSACADAGAFELGKVLHGYIEKAGFSQIISVNNALLDTYAKCGNVGMAQLVFERMPEQKSIISWTTMIAGLAMYGYGREAIKLFDEMEDAGIKPDGISFISILYACSHAGLIDEGSAYFSKMRDVYGIEPSIEHYGCMVDLYGRAGELQKAHEFVCQMPIEPTAIIWRTLLGACSFYGNFKLGERVRERLSELDPLNSGDHVLLSNIYASAGKWKDVVSTRRSMSDQKIVKTPGWSMIEVDKIMYNFMAGQRYSEIVEEAYAKLAEIMLKLKIEGGYVPEGKSVLHDIEEEEREDSLSRHSEKLAVAFGIARLSKGSTIRVVKNLRICRDCHTFMKLISKMFEREIVVRDRSRFHYFRDGSCSCRDYW